MRLGHVFHSVECVSIREDPKEDRIRVIQGVPKKGELFSRGYNFKIGTATSIKFALSESAFGWD